MNDDELKTVPPPDADAMLQALVRLADEELEDVSVQLTLTVGGTVISGRVISRAGFRAGLAELAQLPSLTALPPAGPGDPLPNFIHLTDARYFNGSAPIPTNGPGVLWRGRLSQVDGWNFGQVGLVK